LLDREEVERQNALQAREAAERAGAIVEDQVQSIMDQAAASADDVSRNAAHEAEELRQQAAGSASRVLERIESLNDSLDRLAVELRHEVDGLYAEPRGQREA
jgi:glutamyl-tRNA reductase